MQIFSGVFSETHAGISPKIPIEIFSGTLSEIVTFFLDIPPGNPAMLFSETSSGIVLSIPLGYSKKLF